jgi:hypothetical protein
MEPWFNLFIQVAKPVFTTLVYSSTHLFLDNLKDELRLQQKKQTKLALKALEIEDKKVTKFQDVIQVLSSIIDLENSEKLKLSGEKDQELDRQLIVHSDGRIADAIDRAGERALTWLERQKMMESWPLRLLPHQLLSSRQAGSPSPLKIVLIPPQVAFSELEKLGLGTAEIEQKLGQGVREFLSQHYPLRSPVRPTEFLGGAWNQQWSHGEASIKALFGILKSEPTLILELEVNADCLILRMAYWGCDQTQYCYETLFKLPYPAFLEASVQTRARQWQKTRDKLLALGKPPEVVNRLGGDNALNLALLEEAEALQAAGIDSRELQLAYQVSRQDGEALCQFLTTCLCLVAGWIADIHYLNCADIPPYLPQWLPQLERSLPQPDALEAVVQGTVTIYQQILTALESDRPRYLPALALKLAQSLARLPDKSLAKAQAEYSFECWLQQRHLSLEELERGGIEELAIAPEEREYLNDLQKCLSALGEEGALAQVEQALRGLRASPAAALTPLTSLTPQRRLIALDSHTLTDKGNKIASLTISSAGVQFVSRRDSNHLELWHLDRQERRISPQKRLSGHTGKIETVALSLDGKLLASIDNTKQRSHIKIWDWQTGKLARTLFGHKHPIHALAFGAGDLSSQASLIASGSHKIKLWDLQRGESFLTLFGHKAWVCTLAIDSEGQILASGSQDKTVRLWNLRTGDLLCTLAGHQGAVRSLAFPPDGGTLVSSSDDRTIKCWDLKSGKLLRTFTGHESAVTSLAISPDGQSLISGSQDKTVKLWHLPTGKLLHTLNGHRDAVGAIAISPDGQRLASASEDGTVKLWGLGIGD